MLNTWTVEGRAVTSSSTRSVGEAKMLETFRMVSNWNRKGKDGQWESKALFFDVRRWCSDRVDTRGIHKGDKVVASGQLVNDTFMGKDGTMHDQLRLMASEVVVIPDMRKIVSERQETSATPRQAPISGDPKIDNIAQQFQGNPVLESYDDDPIPF